MENFTEISPNYDEMDKFLEIQRQTMLTNEEIAYLNSLKYIEVI